MSPIERFHDRQSLENRCGWCRYADCFGRRLRVERIPRATVEAIWLEHFGGHPDLYDLHLCSGHRVVFRWTVAEPQRSESRRVDRRLALRRRIDIGKFLQSPAVVAISQLRRDWRH